MNPLDRFLQRIAAIRAQIDRLPDPVVAEILAELDRTRRQVLAELATMDAGSFNAFRLRDLDRRVQDAMDQFAERYGRLVADPQQRLFDLGQELAARPIVDAGVTYGVPQINRRQLETARDFQAMLISGLADDAVNQISQELRLGVLRGESVFEVSQRVAGSLAGPSTFGTIATRAEAITRTELGRIQAIATQAGLEETKRLVPDMQKQWMHSGNTGKYRREGHVEAHDQIRDVEDRFMVRPGPGKPYEAMLFPRDPNASPSNTVFCGCTAIPYRAAWANDLRIAA